MIVCSMRIILVFILFLFLGVTEGKTQRLNDAKTQSEDSASLCLCDSASYYESQIHKADSLYKNYLPQSNFEEVKTAMEFFDSVEVHTQNVQGEYGVNVIELQQIPVGIYILTIKCEGHSISEKLVITK